MIASVDYVYDNDYDDNIWSLMMLIMMSKETIRVLQIAVHWLKTLLFVHFFFFFLRSGGLGVESDSFSAISLVSLSVVNKRKKKCL